MNIKIDIMRRVKGFTPPAIKYINHRPFYIHMKLFYDILLAITDVNISMNRDSRTVYIME